MPSLRASPRSQDRKPFTEMELRQIAEMWADGKTGGQIGLALDRSPASVIGKIHRMKLPPRPSPIRPAGSGRPQAVRWRQIPDPGKRTLPSLTESARPAPRALAQTPAWRDTPPAPREPPAPRIRHYPPAGALRPAHSCQWPIGEPGTPTFRMCSAPSETGRPYCSPHCSLAYVQRVPNEDAAPTTSQP